MTIESINIKPLVIQEGRRYVMRYGGITGVIKKNILSSKYIFEDGHFTWLTSGRFYEYEPSGPRDLIREYSQPEPLPFVLKAGGKYETDTGEIVTLKSTKSTHLSGWHEIAPFIIEWIGVRRYLVTVNGDCVTEDDPILRCRIVREHVPQLTPIERLEMAVGSLASHDATDCVRLIRGVIADLKATVKP